MMTSSRRRVSRWLGMLTAAGFALWGAAGASGAEVPRAARWVADDAAIYLEILRPQAVFDRLSEAPYQTLLRAVPGFRKYLESDDYRQLRAVVDMVARGVDTTAEQGVRDLTAGGLVLAVEGRPGEPVRTILIVTPSDPNLLERAHAKLCELIRADAANKGRPDPIKQGDYRGTTGFRFSPKAAHAIIAGSLVIANDNDALKAVVDRSLDPSALKAPMADNAVWKAQRAALEPEATAWAFVRLDRLRELNPQRFQVPDRPNPLATFLFGSWLEALRHGPWASQSVTLATDRIGVGLTVAAPAAGYSDALKQYAPPAGRGAPIPVSPTGTIASIGLWRDLSAIWDVRADLFPAEVVQNLAKLDTFAGQFFGGREFGSDVLASLGTDWQLVIARQDYEAMSPMPDQKLPAFAIVANLKEDDEDFATRLQVVFQSLVGLANISGAQNNTKAPPLLLGSEVCEGVTIATSRFMPAKGDHPKGEPVHKRHNFSPAVAQVGHRFILSSSVGLARDLVKTLKEPSKPTDTTLLVEANGRQLAQWLESNKAMSVMQNMVEKGNDKATAERDVGQLIDLVRMLGRGTLTANDGADAVRMRLDFALSPK
jgi:hypothetical protein